MLYLVSGFAARERSIVSILYHGLVPIDSKEEEEEEVLG